MSEPANVDTLTLLTQLRERGIRVAVADGRLRVQAPPGTLTAELRAQLAAGKEGVLNFLTRAQAPAAATAPLAAVAHGPHLPLTPAQQSLWYLEQLRPGSAAYHMPLGLRLTGELDHAALQASLQALAARHTALRLGLTDVDGAPAGVLDPEPRIEVEPLAAGPTNRDEIIQQFLHRPFDLHRPPLWRVGLLPVGEQEHLLLIILHHIIGDGWSIGILLRELFTLYADRRRGAASELPPLPVQLPDVAHWQAANSSDEALAPALDYWSRQLAGAPPLLTLPADFPRPRQVDWQGEALHFTLPPALVQQLKALSREAGTTLFMTLLAAYQVLLSRYARQEDVVVGVPMANRSHPDLANVVGYLANTLPLRGRPTADLTFRQFLAQVRETTVAALEHQTLQIDRMVDHLQPERMAGVNPLFQTLFVLQNFSLDLPPLPGLTVSFLELSTATSRMDLMLELWDMPDGRISGMLEYATTLFRRETMTGLIAHLETLLTGIVQRPDAPLGELSLLAPAEAQALLRARNDTATPAPEWLLVHERFAAAAARYPDRVALEAGDSRVTYRELEARANRLAHLLRERGVGPDVVVGIFLPRSVELVVAVLGILKAGGAYLPLDPLYPAARRTYMLTNAGTRLVLTRRPLLTSLAESGVEALLLDEMEAALAHRSVTPPPVDVTTEHLLYVIYTSGSTGKPKGVGLPHRALANLIEWQLRETTLPPGARTAQFTSLSFDVSCQEIFTALCSGDTLIIVPAATRRDPGALARFLVEERIERLFLPFVALQQLAEVLADAPEQPLALREVITAGEQLQATAALRALFQRLPEGVLVNQYGPSESHVVTAHTLAADPLDWPALPPIGKPIDNTQIFLLDERHRPVPPGVVGELYIGGVNVARGYVNQPELTAQRFLPCPFDVARQWTAGDNLMYRTGDLARYLPDGSIQFLGRADGQVKLRGYRVEPGEVELTLAAHPAVRETAVVIREDTPGDPRLVAYLVAGETVTPEALRQFLAPQLPDYMVPAAFVFLEEMPLTGSGKIARRALPAPDYGAARQDTYAAPRTPLETQLAEIWQQVLKVKRVGIHDNFFHLGGHSLMALRLFSAIERDTGRKMPLSTLFEAPTIAEMSARLADDSWQPDWSSLVPMKTGGYRAPFFYVAPYLISVLEMADIARHFPDDRPFYGLQPSGLNEEEPVHDTIEEMAAHYVDAIRSVQPHGPYHLGGHCAGAWVAYEMALQLEQQGECVGSLIITDSPAPNYVDPEGQSLSHLANRLLYYARDHRLINALAWKMRLQLESKLLFRYGSPKARRIQAVREAHDQAYDRYQLRTGYRGPITIIRSTDNMSQFADESWYRNWTELTPGKVAVRDIHSTHAMLIFDPQAKILAGHILDAITIGESQGNTTQMVHP